MADAVGRTTLRWVAAVVLCGALANESEGKLEKRKANTGSRSPFEVGHGSGCSHDARRWAR
jgi:hypothetical protein